MKVAIIGCGQIAHEHERIFRLINRFSTIEVVAVSDKNLEIAKNFAQKHGISKFSSDISEILKIKDLDLIDICTPTSTHSNIVCEIAEFGHNILLEKPMALNSMDCERMISAVTKYGVKLCVCHNQLFFPIVMRAKALVDSGYCNLLRFKTIQKESPEGPITFSPPWVFTPSEKGFLWEFGCHLAYLQMHFLGQIDEVYCISNKIKYKVPDNFSVLLSTNSKTCGYMELELTTKQSKIQYSLDTLEGKSIFFDRLKLSMLENMPVQNKGLFSEMNDVLKTHIQFRKELSTTYNLDYFIGHFNLITRYLQNIEKDLPPPVKPEQAMEVIKLLEAIEKSMELGKPVKVNHD